MSPDLIGRREIAQPSTGASPPHGRAASCGVAGLFGVLTLATGAVGDAFEQPGVVLKGADIAPVDLVRVGVEMIRR